LTKCFTFQVLKAPHGDLLSCMEMAKVSSFVCALYIFLSIKGAEMLISIGYFML